MNSHNFIFVKDILLNIPADYWLLMKIKNKSDIRKNIAYNFSNHWHHLLYTEFADLW